MAANYDQLSFYNKMQEIPDVSVDLRLVSKLLDVNGFWGFENSKKENNKKIFFFEEICKRLGIMCFYFTLENHNYTIDYKLISKGNRKEACLTSNKVLRGIAKFLDVDLSDEQKLDKESLKGAINVKLEEFKNINNPKELEDVHILMYDRIYKSLLKWVQESENEYGMNRSMFMENGVFNEKSFTKYLENYYKKKGRKISNHNLSMELEVFKMVCDFEHFKKNYIKYVDTLVNNPRAEELFNQYEIDIKNNKYKTSEFNKFHMLIALAAYSDLKNTKDEAKRAEYVRVIDDFFEKVKNDDFELIVNNFFNTKMSVSDFRKRYSTYIIDYYKEKRENDILNKENKPKSEKEVEEENAASHLESITAEDRDKEMKDDIKKLVEIDPEKAQLAKEIAEFYNNETSPVKTLKGTALFAAKKSYIFIYENGMVVIDRFPDIETSNSGRAQRIYVFPITKLFDVLKCKTDKEVGDLVGYNNHGSKGTPWQDRLLEKMQGTNITPTELASIMDKLQEYDIVDINDLKIYEQKALSLKTSERYRIASKEIADSMALCGSEMYDDILDSEREEIDALEDDLAEILGIENHHDKSKKKGRSSSSRGYGRSESSSGNGGSSGSSSKGSESSSKSDGKEDEELEDKSKDSSVPKEKKGPMSFSDMMKQFEKTPKGREILAKIKKGYKRNPYVSLYTKERAKDKDGNYCCDLCGGKSFFGDGFESHHLIPLKDGGVDNICNTVCLCSYCHDFIHSRKAPLTLYQQSKIWNDLYNYVKDRDPEFLDFVIKYFEYKEPVVRPDFELTDEKVNDIYDPEDYNKEKSSIRKKYEELRDYIKLNVPQEHMAFLDAEDNKGGRK